MFNSIKKQLCNPATLFQVLMMAVSAVNSNAQMPGGIHASGYVQGLPVRISAELPPPIGEDDFWEYRMQNRLNLEWFVRPDLSLNWQMRTRLFAGDLVRDIPFYADIIDFDNGFFDLSWLIFEQDDWLLHYIPDRLYLDWTLPDWTIRVGRQRINWGINMVTNPNDLFNIYSFYEFDYPERPGTDAVRMQYFTGPFSRWELAVSPGRDRDHPAIVDDRDRSVAALLYGFNTRGYDVQLIGAWYHERLAAGGGWAGSIAQTGFKGEVMVFSDINNAGSGGRETNIVAAVSADHMFTNSIFLVVEGLYNQRGGLDQFMLTGDQLTADNPSFSRFQFTGHASYPISPILTGSLATIFYPDEEAVFFSPSVTWSVLQDLDLNVLAQIFTGSDDSAFATAGNVVAASLKWSF